MSERNDYRQQPTEEFDSLLRAALSTYGDPGPDSGLAQRVLAHVRAEGERARTRQWLPWVFALPVAASLMVLIMVFGSNPIHRQLERTNHARVFEPPSASTRGSAASISRSAPDQPVKVSRPKAHPHHALTMTKVALPKRAVFPTPQPLTPAERALADYAAHAPQADRQALIETHKKIEEPLSIAAIEIQPIGTPQEGGN